MANPNVERITKKLFDPTNPIKLLSTVIVIALVLGVITGAVLAKGGGSGIQSQLTLPDAPPKSAEQDNRTFRDFAEGTVELKPTPKKPTEYTEGTHLLKRDGAVPVALTSSVVDLAQYEGKKVKVYGETQKAIKEGWLMDVGKVEELK